MTKYSPPAVHADLGLLAEGMNPKLIVPLDVPAWMKELLTPAPIPLEHLSDTGPVVPLPRYAAMDNKTSLPNSAEVCAEVYVPSLSLPSISPPSSPSYVTAASTTQKIPIARGEVAKSRYERRRLCNRLSAQLSRQRKKEFVTILENKLATLQTSHDELQCSALRLFNENARLRQLLAKHGIET
eukprot:TRINITY_DN8013_c0_g1_i1.p1 TRINITY_DN8013_c0_g1~~TRINITY_DN8013_c0_g1_i1.p1  ORF type:complete len:184 (+),score=7.10 TRINITY_DN8013_c0_g1_i1:40-591(+)